MSLSINLDGTLSIQLTEESRPSLVPVRFTRNYTKKAMHTFAHTSPLTNSAVGQGAVTAPKLVLIWVRAGTVSFSWANDGAAPTVIKASDTPPPGDPPVMILMRDDPGAGQLYMTTTGPVEGDVWVFS